MRATSSTANAVRDILATNEHKRNISGSRNIQILGKTLWFRVRDNYLIVAINREGHHQNYLDGHDSYELVEHTYLSDTP